MTPVSRLASSVLSAALVGVIVLAAYADPALVAAAVVVVQALVASAPRLRDARGRSIATPRFVPAILAGLVASVLVLMPDLLPRAEGTHDVFAAATTGSFSGVLPAVAVGVFAAAITQMVRRDGRRELASALAYATTLAVTSALAAGWIGASQSFGQADSVAIGAAGLAFGLLIWAIPGDRYLLGGAAVVGGAAAAALVCVLVEPGPHPLLGVAVGGGSASFGVIGQVLGRALISGRSHASVGWGFPGATAVALAAPIVYIGSQLVATRGL